jgi:hypothetical protein
MTRAAAVLGLAMVAAGCSTSSSNSSGGNDAGYLGTTVPVGFTAFSLGSPRRTPIADLPSADQQPGANSDAMMMALQTALTGLGEARTLKINYKIDTAPVHFVDSDLSQKVSVPCDSDLPEALDPNQDKVVENVPIPDSAWADPFRVLQCDTTTR